MPLSLNESAGRLVDELGQEVEALRVVRHALPGGGRVYDFGVETAGSLSAGLRLAEICMAGRGDVALTPGDVEGVGWPHVQVSTDAPVAACLCSQYAGWQISVDKFFAMGSGPMRAAAAREELFEKLDYREKAERCVGVLEGAKLPDDRVFDEIASKTGIDPSASVLLVAPTASLAGTLQVVARSVETAMHKLFELGFDVTRVQSAFGSAPLAPVAADDLAAIGRTNDAILYGASVTLWVVGDDASLYEIGPQVPSDSSSAYGKPFLEIFEDAGRDFYKIDPLLFSPAEIVFQNIESGRVHGFGKVEPDVLDVSFGLRD